MISASSTITLTAAATVQLANPTHLTVGYSHIVLTYVSFPIHALHCNTASARWPASRIMLATMCSFPAFVLPDAAAGSWIGTNGAVSFGLSVAVGLTPELLPMVVTANLCCGALAMAKRKNIVRHMDSIPNLGAM